ncbi:MAG: lamin tail domain-containing protein [Bacteroidales bacterium]
MKIKILILMISVIGILNSGCVKDDIYIDKNVDSDVALVINEVASNNGDPNPDWIELYNPTDAAIDISGFSLSDKPTFPTGVVFPAGTVVSAKGYYIYVCGTLGATFSISSTNGETVYLFDATGAIVDEVATPKMNVGVTWSRIPDGGLVFDNANPTQGIANSNTNEPPIIEADTLVTGMVSDNERFQYDIVVKDASGIDEVKLWLQTATETFYFDMVPMGGGNYRLLFPLLEQGPISYYIEATDATGLKTTFKPATAPAITLNVIDGLAVFNSVNVSNNNPAALEDIVITVDAWDKSGIAAVRMYYLVNDEVAANKIQVDLTFADGVWTGTIPGQLDGATIRYYIRATDNTGTKSYYPVEELDADGNVIGDFNHDDATTWPQINVVPLVFLNQLVINEINASGLPYDFIELYNGTNASIDISGYKVYDSGGLGVAYIIPASTTIDAGGFYLIETGSGSPQGQFGISSSGEDITLVNTTDVIVDQLLKVNWPGVPLVARKKDAAEVWVVPAAETKGTSNN